MRSAGTWDQLLTVTQAKLSTQGAPERRKVATDSLTPNPEQPRRHFEPQALEELAASVRAHGLLQPILVRPHPQDKQRFEIVAGERRWRAARECALAEVPVVVRELTDAEALELALVENVLREDISPMEEARALQSLLDTFGYSYAQLGERLGKNKAYVDHRVRLLKMPTEIREALERTVETAEGKVERPFTPRHAGVVCQLADEAAREAMIGAIFEERLPVAEATRRKNRLMAPALPERVAGLTVKVDELALAAVLDQARASGGTVDAVRLLEALDRDRKHLRALAGMASAGDGA